MKECRDCKQTLNDGSFRVIKTNGKLCGACKSCESEYKKRWAEKNKDLLKQKRDAYAVANKDKILERAKRYREGNKEKVSESQKRSYYAKPDYYRAYSRQWARENPDAVKEASAKAVQRRRDNPEVARQREAGYRAKNREAARARNKAYSERNKTRVKEFRKRYKQRNRYKITADAAIRRAAARRAFPAWADKRLIKQFYHSAHGLSMLLGEWHHVDHIVPLISEFVCGLHCEANLQILPQFDNLSKGNRWWPDMWEPLSNAITEK